MGVCSNGVGDGHTAGKTGLALWSVVKAAPQIHPTQNTRSAPWEWELEDSTWGRRRAPCGKMGGAWAENAGSGSRLLASPTSALGLGPGSGKGQDSYLG